MSEGKSFKIHRFGDESEKNRRQSFVDLLKQSPIPDDELLMNLGLFIPPSTLSRILFLDFLYRQVLEVQGVIIEFGCRWGQTVSLFTSMRGIYEPFNRLRKIIAFDTFEGFPGVSKKDGSIMKEGGYGVSEEYKEFLESVLAIQEAESPMAHLKKHEVIRGDAAEQINEYLDGNPETIVALAYFDLDLYEPTVACLKAVRDRLTRGSVLGFDELLEHVTPGETQALKDVVGLDKYAIRRTPYNSRSSYLVID